MDDGRFSLQYTEALSRSVAGLGRLYRGVLASADWNQEERGLCL